MGILERGGKVRTKIVDNTKKKTLQSEIREIDEQAFRYNNRPMNDGDRFDIVVRQIVGKRLTWDQLTGNVRQSESSQAGAGGSGKPVSPTSGPT
jgi:hypothetical protein